VKKLAGFLMFVAALVGCSPADWAAARSAGQTVGAAVDTFAIVRAEQLRAQAPPVPSGAIVAMPLDVFERVCPRAPATVAPMATSAPSAGGAP
jgi:hypothetical protein